MHPEIRVLSQWVDPAAAFERIPGMRRFFLDSSLPMGELTRWSFASAEPFIFFTAKGDEICVETRTGRSRFKADPFDTLNELLGRHHFPIHEGPPLTCGAVGYFSYDLGRMIESIPSTAVTDLPIPDIQIGIYDCILAFDNYENRIYVCYLKSGESKARLWTSELETLDPGNHLYSDPDTLLASAAMELRKMEREPIPESNFTREHYLSAIRRVQEYIASGDVYQVNLSQRFIMPFAGDRWRLYKLLRRVNPSPFGCFIDFDDLCLACASPERLLKLDASSRLVETRPIKGTRPRGWDPISDQYLRAELAASEKDRAENVMIVDMERNDLGRVCEYGSIHVPHLWTIEEHPNVFQMVSTVRGVLRRDKSPIDLLRAAFPGGSVTGAPKVRAMEIIEELEGVRRGIYTGSVGYIDFCGNMDLNIIIRSIVLARGCAWFHGGGGILSYSDPEAEYNETLEKVAGLISALRTYAASG